MLAWLDFDSDAMKKANELLQQFRDARTLDHLRLSGIRDDFANLFFPATSTIMPHARYLILVPRTFLRLEAEIKKKGYSFQQAMIRLDEIEAEQAKALMNELARTLNKRAPDRKDLEGSGIIGWDKIIETNGSEFVSQTPSNNYWASIRKLQIRLPKGSRATYVRDLVGRAKVKLRRIGVPDDESAGLEAVVWNKDALDLANDKNSLCLELNEVQAEFIKRQYVGLESLISRLLVDNSIGFAKKSDLYESEYVWDYPSLPEPDYEIVETARRLSALIQGANLVYGTMVAKEYGLESQPIFSSWQPELEKWFDLKQSELGAKAAIKLEWGPMSIVCRDRSLDLLFLKEIQANLKKAKSVDDFLSTCASGVIRREKSIKTMSYRLGRIKSGASVDKKKYRERVLRQPVLLTSAPDFRWRMAREFMWNINQGLKRWG